MALTKTRSQRKQTKPKRTKRQVSQAPIAQTFMQHVFELRKRLFWTVLLGLVLGSVVYSYHDFFLHLIMKPLGDEKLIYLTPAGGFAFIFSATMYVTAIGLLPFLVYQIYAFLRPAIPSHANRLSVRMALSALLLMVGGAVFGYYVAVPRGLQFLTTFASDYVIPSLTAESYLNFVFGYVLGIGMLFQLPLILLIIHWVHPLSLKGLLNSERYIIVIAFILAAIISPTPDPLNQAIIAVPIIVVYQFGVIAVWVSIRKERKLAKKALAKERQAPPRPPEPPRPLPQSKPVATPALRPAAVVPSSVVRRPVTTVSLDGFRPRQQVPASKMHAQFSQTKPVERKRQVMDGVKKTTNIQPLQPSKNRGSIVVPRRNTGLISDFGPIRRSAIDIVR